MKREYPKQPIAAVGVVVFQKDQVLLVKRNKPPKSDEWSIPGGAQDLGEALKEAAAREVMEETNIRINNITLVDAVDYIKNDDAGTVEYHYSLIDYMAEYMSGELLAADDAHEAKWVPLTDLEGYNLWEETRRLISKAENLRNS